MDNYNVILECFEKSEEPMNATVVATKLEQIKKKLQKLWTS